MPWLCQWPYKSIRGCFNFWPHVTGITGSWRWIWPTSWSCPPVNAARLRFRCDGTDFRRLLVCLWQRHGVAVLLVLLLCASLFLVYNGSFSIASRDANDTRIRQHEQLRRPTEASVRVAKPHPPVLQGYSGIIDHKVSRCGSVRLSLRTVTSGVCLKRKIGTTVFQTTDSFPFRVKQQFVHCMLTLHTWNTRRRAPFLCTEPLPVVYHYFLRRHTQYPPVVTNNKILGSVLAL